MVKMFNNYKNHKDTLNKKRVVIISPTYLNEFCGVGDSTYYIATALANSGCETTVISKGSKNKSLENGIEVIRSEVLDTNETEDIISNSTHVLIQFTPQLYEKYWGLVKLIRYLIKIKLMYQTNLMCWFHESHYPVSLSVRGLYYGMRHHCFASRIISISDKSFFTYSYNMTYWSKVLCEHSEKIKLLPVGSNIDLLISSLDPTNEVDEYLNKPYILYFGGMHPTISIDLINLSVTIAKQNGVRVVFCGTSKEGAKSNGVLVDESIVKFTGTASSSIVSTLLSGAIAVICPYVDGVSTRRGTFMAAIAHGKPVLTTTGWATDNNIPWNNFCVAVPFGRDKSTAKLWRFELDKMIQSREMLPSTLGERARSYYDTNFDWSTKVGNILE